MSHFHLSHFINDKNGTGNGYPNLNTINLSTRLAYYIRC